MLFEAAMPLELPNLVEASCRVFSACGEVKTTSKNSKKALGKNAEWMTARATTGGKVAFVRASFGSKTGKHCHIDFAIGDSFRRGKRPKVTHTKEAIDEVISKLEGHSIEVEATGWFYLPVDDLSPAIKFAAEIIDTEQDDVSIKMTSGKLTVSGTPVNTIEWHLTGDGSVAICIQARTEAIVNDSYLPRLFSILTVALRSFVRSEVQNADG
jgi:hypothetical protein